MSRLMDIDPQIQLQPELEGYEFGNYTFDPLPTLEVSNIETTQSLSLEMKDKDAPNDNLWKLPLIMIFYTSCNGKMYFVKIY